jgi:hypothetical protein
MALTGTEYALLSMIGLLALLFPLFGTRRRACRSQKAEPTEFQKLVTRLEVLHDSQGRLLAEFIPMEPIDDVDELRGFQGRWLRDSRLCGEPLGLALRREDCFYWEIMVFRQSDGPRLAVHFSITPELYLALSPPAGLAAN